jgi:hypothetical protein
MEYWESKKKSIVGSSFSGRYSLENQGAILLSTRLNSGG